MFKVRLVYVNDMNINSRYRCFLCVSKTCDKEFEKGVCKSRNDTTYLYLLLCVSIYNTLIAYFKKEL